ncbi:hypothetical protein BOX15_Mlig033387g1, partial [Macrostomum lignano]
TETCISQRLIFWNSVSSFSCLIALRLKRLRMIVVDEASGCALLPLLILASMALLCHGQTADGLTCYKCSNSRDLSVCLSRTETCSGSESCYKAETAGSMTGVVEKYSMGCMDTTTCARQPQSTARDLCDNAGQTCYSCCRDRSYCNSGTRPAIDLRQVVVALAIACCLPGLRA